MSPLRSLLAILSLISPLAASHAADAPRPNVIFILCDDLGYGDTGTFFQNLRSTANDRSEPWHVTPRLDQMAAEGLRLPHHYCPAPVCAPSRASLLLGVHQGHSNIRDNQFDKGLENNHTVGTILQHAGYRTAAIGKWGLQGTGTAPDWAAHPLNRGFDFYHGYMRHGDGHAHYPKEDGKQIWEMKTDITAQCDKCYTTDLFTARSKKWMADHRSANPTQPFFLYLAYDTPHAELQLPTGPYPAGGGLTGGLQWTGTPGNLITSATGTIDSYYHPAYATATWDHDKNPATAEVPWPDVYKRYATDVRRIDDCVGDLIQTLKDLNIDNNTLIVFTTDNGPSKESYLPEAYEPHFFNSFGPFDGIKRDCWEGGIRVGAIVRWPSGITPGRTSNLPCQFHDWLPTFSTLAGLTPPAHSDGVSLVPTLLNTGIQAPPTVYVEYFESGTTPAYTEFASSKRSRRRNQMQMIRRGDFVGVRYNISSHQDNFEIYNILTNPAQTTNLASSQTALQQEMKDTVLRLRRPGGGVTRPYDNDFIPPLNPSPVTSGVSWKSFDGPFDYVPDLTTLTPTQSGTGPRPDSAVRPRDNDVALLFNGYLQIPADGNYTFYLNTGTRAYLRLHETSLLDADKNYAPGTEISATVALKAGRHPWRLSWTRNTTGSTALAWLWSGPGFAKQPIPDTAFLRDGTGSGNLPPSATDDRIKTSQNTPATFSPLANDSDDGLPQPLSLTSFTSPTAGTLQQTGNSLTYTPRAGFLGEDTLTYTMTDGASPATATVTIIVGYSDNDFWFPLDETAGLTATEAGGLKTATLNGFTTDPAHWIPGKSGKALTCDGTDDHLTIDNFNGITGTNPRTISAWVRTNATGVNRPIVAWGPNTASNKWTFLMNTAGQIRTEVGSGLIVGTRPINNGQWRHVACTFSGTNVTDIKLYVDGTLETASSTTPLAINTTTSGPVKIGSDIQNRFWLGDLDDVRIYQRALSASEIAALAQGTRQSADAWLRRHYGASPTSWTADADQDGASTLIEFALGQQPNLSDPPFQPTLIPNDTEWEVTLRRRLSEFGVTSQLELSSDLTTWSTAAALADPPIPDGADRAFESITFSFPHTPPRTFCRLRFLLP